MWLLCGRQTEGFLVVGWARSLCRFAVCERLEKSSKSNGNNCTSEKSSPLPSAQSKLTEEYGLERKQRDREIPRAVLFNHELWNNSNRQGLPWEKGWRINMCLWENVQAPRAHTRTHTHSEPRLGRGNIPTPGLRGGAKRRNRGWRVRKDDKGEKRRRRDGEQSN